MKVYWSESKKMSMLHRNFQCIFKKGIIYIMKNEQIIWHAFQLTNHWNRHIPFNQVYHWRFLLVSNVRVHGVYDCFDVMRFAFNITRTWRVHKVFNSFLLHSKAFVTSLLHFVCNAARESLMYSRHAADAFVLCV